MRIGITVISVLVGALVGIEECSQLTLILVPRRRIGRQVGYVMTHEPVYFTSFHLTRHFTVSFILTFTASA